MKRIKCWQACTMLALVIVLAISCNKDDDTIYGNKIIDITVPSSWFYRWYANDNALYYGWSPQNEDDDMSGVRDSINEDIYITRQHLPGLDLSDFYYYTYLNMGEDTSFHYIYDSDTVINGENAVKLIHLQTIKLPSLSVPNDSFYLQIQPMKIFLFKDDYGYILDCGMLPYTYPYYKPIFEDIISTFKFKN